MLPLWPNSWQHLPHESPQHLATLIVKSLAMSLLSLKKLCLFFFFATLINQWQVASHQFPFTWWELLPTILLITLIHLPTKSFYIPRSPSNSFWVLGENLGCLVKLTLGKKSRFMWPPDLTFWLLGLDTKCHRPIILWPNCMVLTCLLGQQTNIFLTLLATLSENTKHYRSWLQANQASLHNFDS